MSCLNQAENVYYVDMIWKINLLMSWGDIIEPGDIIPDGR